MGVWGRLTRHTRRPKSGHEEGPEDDPRQDAHQEEPPQSPGSRRPRHRPRRNPHAPLPRLRARHRGRRPKPELVSVRRVAAVSRLLTPEELKALLAAEPYVPAPTERFHI